MSNLVGLFTKRHPPARWVLAAAASLALACTSKPPTEASPAPIEPPAPAPVADVPAAGLKAPDDTAPVLRIESGRIALDGEAVVTLDGFSVPADVERGYLIRPLFEVLTATYDARRIAKRREQVMVVGKDGVMTLSVHPETPYRLLATVLYTAGQAQFDQLSVRVQTPDGARFLPLELPRIGTALPGSDIEHAATCAAADSVVVEGGVWVKSRSSFVNDNPGRGPTLLAEPASKVDRVDGIGLLGDEKGAVFETKSGEGIAALLGTGPSDPAGQTRRGLEPPAPPIVTPPHPSDWRRVIMLSAKGVCPSVPRRGKRIDRAGLKTLLDTVHAIEPGCTDGTVGADDPMPWQDVADVLQVYLARGNHPVLVMSGNGDGPDCSAGRVATQFGDAP